MRLLLFVLTLFLFETSAAYGLSSTKVAPPELVEKALANPKRYHFDDGGNISFGNGFYVRRFSFAGRPNACYKGKYLYAGVRKKCVEPIYQGDEVKGCNKYDQVQLKTQMTGSAQICSETAGDDGPCKKFSTVKFNKGPRVKVAIYKKSQMSDHNPNSGFQGYTHLNLPKCR